MVVNPVLTAADVVADAPVIPVIVVDDVRLAVHMAKALVAGGIRMLEITLRTSQALAAMETIAKEVPEAVVGAGTVRKPEDVRAAANAGARFAVSPGYTAAVGQACRDVQLPLLPGVATGSEIMKVQADGWEVMKFFPATAAGGTPLLKAWYGPFSDVRFCPTGGINQSNAAEFLCLPNVACIGGSWLTPAHAVLNRDWQVIQLLAAQAKQLARL